MQCGTFSCRVFVIVYVIVHGAVQGTAEEIKLSQAGEAASISSEILDGDDPRRTTLIVPDSRHIQIAFSDVDRSDRGDDSTDRMHADLLRLYQRVMTEVLSRDHLRERLTHLENRLDAVDDLQMKVNQLELGIKDMTYILKQRLPGVLSSASPPPTTEEPSFEDDFEDIVHGDNDDDGLSVEDSGSTGEVISSSGEAPMEGALDWIFETESPETDSTASKSSVLSSLQERVAKLELAFAEEREKLKEQGDKIHRIRGITIKNTERLEAQESQTSILSTGVDIQKAHLEKIKVDNYWQRFRLGEVVNNTGRLKKALGEVDASIRGIYSDHGSFYTRLDALKKESVQHANESSHLDNRLGALEKALEFVRGDSPTDFLGEDNSLETTPPRFDPHLLQLVRDMNASQVKMFKGAILLQQQELDDQSLDMESLKDEMNNLEESHRQMQQRVDGMDATYGDENKRLVKRMRRFNHKLEALFHAFNNGQGNMSALGDMDFSMESWDSVSTTLPASSPQSKSEGGKYYVTPPLQTRLRTGTSSRHQSKRHYGITTQLQPADVEDATLESKTDGADVEELNVKDLRGEECVINGFGQAVVVDVLATVISGSWMRDAASLSDYLYVLSGNGQSEANRLLRYVDENEMRRNNISVTHTLPFRCAGDGHVIYQGRLYCNVYRTNKVIQYDLTTRQYIHKRIFDAGYNNTYPYSYGGHTDMDFAVDEKGLWVVYGSLAHQGQLTIAKLTPDTLDVEETWTSRHDKRLVSNSFLLCGHLYLADYARSGIIRFAAIINLGSQVEHPPGMKTWIKTQHDDQPTMLDYNPKDRRLYSWHISTKTWDSHLVRYDVHMDD